MTAITLYDLTAMEQRIGHRFDTLEKNIDAKIDKEINALATMTAKSFDIVFKRLDTIEADLAPLVRGNIIHRLDTMTDDVRRIKTRLNMD